MADAYTTHVLTTLTTGTQLLKGAAYASYAPGDANVTLLFQDDGNLVLTDAETQKVWWASNTAQSETSDPGSNCEFGNDGNLVIYDASGRVVWASGTEGHPDALLCIQNDGNVVIYSQPWTPLWATDTVHADRQ